MWLYDTGSSEQIEIVPAGVCPAIYSPQWRPDGERFAFACGPGVDTDVFVYAADGTLVERLDGYGGAGGSGWSTDGTHILLRKVPDDPQLIDNFEDGVLYTFSQNGEPGTFTTIEDALPLGFSPDSRRLVYRRMPDAPCVPTCETGLIIRDLTTGEERAYGNYAVIDWVRDGSAMLVETQPPVDARQAITAAGILDLTSGELIPAPELNGVGALYPTVRDDTWVALVASGSPLSLSIVDIREGSVRPIIGSTISFPSDHIPSSHITSTEEHIYWFDVGEPTAWYRANYDGSDKEMLSEAFTTFMQFSPSVTHVAYPSTQDGEQATIVAHIEGHPHINIGSSGFAMAWRPTDD